MSDSIIPFDSPLMQPFYDSNQREYYSGQRIHRDYMLDMAHHPELKVKYQDYSHFARRLREIDIYDNYIASKDIFQVTWQEMKSAILKWDRSKKSEVYASAQLWKALFLASSYQPITFFSREAQAELTHHLDNPMSKALAIGANQLTVEQITGQIAVGSLPIEILDRTLAAFLSIAQQFGTPLHIVYQEAVKYIEATYGVNLRPLLTGTAAQDNIPAASVMLEPADLAGPLGLKNGMAVNKQLALMGWQELTGNSTEKWKPTVKGAPHAQRHAWTSRYGTKTGYNYKWNLEAVSRAILEWLGKDA